MYITALMGFSWRALSFIVLVNIFFPNQLNAQQNQHQHHQHQNHSPAKNLEQKNVDHSAHNHEVGPAGATYDLRWLDAMQQHHMGALLMSEYVFDIGVPGVGALAKTIWRDQAQEIKSMGQWRKAWFPEAPVYSVMLANGGDPDSLKALTRMSAAHIEAMRMITNTPTRANRVSWFLEGMLQHHGGALQMAHDALKKSNNSTIKRLAREIIIGQSHEIVELRGMLQHDGLNKPEYYQFDKLFSF
jgi:uncharacterized protein (DUF305 family)